MTPCALFYLPGLMPGGIGNGFGIFFPRPFPIRFYLSVCPLSSCWPKRRGGGEGGGLLPHQSWRILSRGHRDHVPAAIVFSTRLVLCGIGDLPCKGPRFGLGGRYACTACLTPSHLERRRTSVRAHSACGRGLAVYSSSFVVCVLLHWHVIFGTLVLLRSPRSFICCIRPWRETSKAEKKSDKRKTVSLSAELWRW